MTQLRSPKSRGSRFSSRGPLGADGCEIAFSSGRVFCRTWPDCRVLLAAAAGLAKSFYVAIAAAVFVFEILVQEFDLAMPVLPGCCPFNPSRSPSKRI
jgi:chloride channel protein, CIC family